MADPRKSVETLQSKLRDGRRGGSDVDPKALLDFSDRLDLLNSSESYLSTWLGDHPASDDPIGLKLRLPTTQREIGADVGGDFERWFDQKTGAIVSLPAE